MSVTSALDLGVAFGLWGAKGETETFPFLESFILISPPNEGGPASEGRTTYIQPENEELYYPIVSTPFLQTLQDSCEIW